MPIVNCGYGNVPTSHECVVIKERLNIILQIVLYPFIRVMNKLLERSCAKFCKQIYGCFEAIKVFPKTN
jgi:hypothetical protein